MLSLLKQWYHDNYKSINCRIKYMLILSFVPLLTLVAAVWLTFLILLIELPNGVKESEFGPQLLRSVFDGTIRGC